MSFPTTPVNGARHRENQQGYVAVGGKWMREPEDSVKQFNQLNASEIDCNISTLQKGNPINVIECDFLVIPKTDQWLKVSFNTKAGWFNWGNTADHVKFTGYLTSGAGNWGKTDWQSGQSWAGNHGIRLDWNDGSWVMKSGRISTLNIRLIRLDSNWVTFHSRFIFVNKDNNSSKSEVIGQMKMKLEEIITIAVYTQGNVDHSSIARAY